MKVALSGSRDFPDRDLVEHVLDRLIERDVHIVIGCAISRGRVRCTRGVDEWAHEYLSYRDDDVFWETVEAEWDRYGKRAGFDRNELMIHKSQELVALFAPGELSPGTSNAVWNAQKKGIPMYIYHEGRWTTTER